MKKINEPEDNLDIISKLWELDELEEITLVPADRNFLKALQSNEITDTDKKILDVLWTKYVKS